MGVAPGGEFTGAQLAEKTGVFDASGIDVGNIRGIEYLTNIQVFDLSNNHISLLTPLVNMDLPQGTILDVSKNSLTYRSNLKEVLVLLNRLGSLFIHSPQNVGSYLPPLSGNIAPWTLHDIGVVRTEGIAAAAQTQPATFAVLGSGVGLGRVNESFHYVCQPYTGDCEMTARVVHLGLTTNSNKTGILFRESLESNAPFVSISVVRNNGIHIQYRTAASVTDTIILDPNKIFSRPVWLKVIRNKNDFEIYTSPEGMVWELVNQITNPMSSQFYVGVVVTSQNNNETCESLVDQVSVRKYVYQPPTPTPTPTLTPTPVVFDPRPKTVIVTDTTQTRDDLAGGYDQDAENERALVIRWNLGVLDAADYHVYVRVNQFKQAFFLGRTASGARNYFEWRPGAPFLAPEFANGPIYGNYYSFIVYAIREGQNPVSAQTQGDVFFWSDKPLPTPTNTFTPTPSWTPTNTFTPTPSPTPTPLPGSVYGIVYDEATFDPVVGALVTVGEISTRTDSNGAFRLNNIPAGPQTMKVTAGDYLSIERIVIVSGSIEVNVSLPKIGAKITINLPNLPAGAKPLEMVL
ncbi:MAG TPA: carboxypeptidase regulatory-like domain-containing protein, partial [bacterium]|nr:carboxypeptidase regulatory-like domain-containing protein [bacterium]HPP03142.1 carboxypeptidase regulatory-like domain-containing protein [bacterium]